jgi:hypothetical protein
MARHPRSVDDAIARFDEVVARYDGRTVEAVGARRRHYARGARTVAKRLAGMGVAVAVLAVATVIFSQLIGPIGLTGLFIVSLLTLGILVLFSAVPIEPKRVEYSEEVPTKTILRQLDSLLVRERPALPAPAARRVDAIAATLPLLESRLTEIDPLDPLAQDARRLMGKHLPELIQRYEKVPAAYRAERDGDGLTVDERLVSGLEAARTALDDIGARLAQTDRQAFETQGRFIESRYKDPGGFAGQ